MTVFAIAGLFGVLSALGVAAVWRARAAAWVGTCARCGYRMPATEGTCPECGSTGPGRRKTLRRRRITGVTVVIASVSLASGVLALSTLEPRVWVWAIRGDLGEPLRRRAVARWQDIQFADEAELAACAEWTALTLVARGAGPDDARSRADWGFVVGAAARGRVVSTRLDAVLAGAAPQSCPGLHMMYALAPTPSMPAWCLECVKQSGDEEIRGRGVLLLGDAEVPGDVSARCDILGVVARELLTRKQEDTFFVLGLMTLRRHRAACPELVMWIDAMVDGEESRERAAAIVTALGGRSRLGSP